MFTGMTTYDCCDFACFAKNNNSENIQSLFSNKEDRMFSFCDLEKDRNRVSVFQAHLEAPLLDFLHSPTEAVLPPAAKQKNCNSQTPTIH